MTSLTDRPDTALLVIDMQRGVVERSHDLDNVVANIGTLVDRARDQGTAVIWVRHASADMEEGSDGWEYVPELQRQDDEPLVHKRFGDSFESTDLESTLARLGVGHLVVTGAQTDACIRSTLHGALARGYDVTLVGDAHTTEDMRQWGSPISAAQSIAYANMYWSFSAAPDRTCATVPTAEVEFTAA